METGICESLSYNRHTYHAIWINESICTARTLEDSDLEKAYTLRHQIFADELAWVPKNRKQLEIDQYDSNSIHFGVFSGRELLVYLRLIMSENKFMLENEFIDLISDNHTIRKLSDTSEVSRLCISPLWRTYGSLPTDFGNYDIAMLLYKCVYNWCKINGVRYLYFVVSQQVFRLLNARGFPCDLIGTPKHMPDGITAVAAILDWRNFEKRSALKKPKLLAWFNRDLSGQERPLLPRLETCLPPQAFEKHYKCGN